MPDLQNTKYFDIDPDWQKFASEHGYTPKTEPREIANPADIPGDRTAQNISEGEWETSHPLRDVGYTSRFEQVSVRDGEKVWIKICRSNRVGKDEKLPLVFPLMQRFDFVTISVDYRLAPEYKYPTFINHSWDALKNVLSCVDELGFNSKKVLLAGSSARACMAASLAQQARSAGLRLKGVVLNVPITCDPRHFPSNDYAFTSYDQCSSTLLSGGEMKQIWKLVVPEEEGKSTLISPLLGDFTGLPPHAVFVAGQDPLRDEGIAYAEKLKSSGVQTIQHIYPGVPHIWGVLGLDRNAEVLGKFAGRGAIVVERLKFVRRQSSQQRKDAGKSQPATGKLFVSRTSSQHAHLASK